MQVRQGRNTRETETSHQNFRRARRAGLLPDLNQSAYLLFFPCVVALCAILPDSVSEPQEKNMIDLRRPCPGGETPGVQACQP